MPPPRRCPPCLPLLLTVKEEKGEVCMDAAGEERGMDGGFLSSLFSICRDKCWGGKLSSVPAPPAAVHPETRGPMGCAGPSIHPHEEPDEELPQVWPYGAHGYNGCLGSTCSTKCSNARTGDTRQGEQGEGQRRGRLG
ncbi:unnamed protein product [Urochloa humidicola]